MDGTFFDEPIPKPAPNPLPNATSDNPWEPFSDRLAFDWARYHYVRLQSSADDIHEGLDLWRATIIKHQTEHGIPESDGVPWKNANDLYSTIDSISVGGIGWKTFQFRYTGPKPQMPPQWMEKTYDLNTRNILTLIEHQLASTEFDGKVEYVPFEEYDCHGDRVHSHLMSAYWANREAVGCLLKSRLYLFNRNTGYNC